MNRGMRLTPIGASDSHDVTRFVVGQGRTYVRTGDNDPGHIDVPAAVEAIKRGHVLVSYGLLTDLNVNRKTGPGDVVTTSDNIDVEVSVSGPAWTQATRAELYANGMKIREEAIGPQSAGRAGLKASINWRLPTPAHDIYLTAIAVGPGVTAPYWPGAKPYQRTSSHWEPYVLGYTGAVFIDADRSGKFDSAFDYAERIVTAAREDVANVVTKLADYDASVAAQAASLLRARHKFETPQAVDEAAAGAAPAVRAGFSAFADAWRASSSK